MSKINIINFTEYLNDSDSESTNNEVMETYSNTEIKKENYTNISYEDCNCDEKHINLESPDIHKSVYDKLNSNDSYKKYVKDLSNNSINESENCKSECNSETLNGKDYCYDHSNMDFQSQIDTKKVKCIKEKDDGIEIRQIYLQKKIEKLEKIGNSFKKIGHSIEYYKYNLENSKDVILRESDEEAINLLNDTSLNLHNIILLEINSTLNQSKLRYITIENVNLFEIPNIEVKFYNGVIMFNIIDNKKIYNYTIGCDYSESNDIEESIDDAIIDTNNVYNYFNSRFNKISTIINYIKINSM